MSLCYLAESNYFKEIMKENSLWKWRRSKTRLSGSWNKGSFSWVCPRYWVTNEPIIFSNLIHRTHLASGYQFVRQYIVWIQIIGLTKSWMWTMYCMNTLLKVSTEQPKNIQSNETLLKICLWNRSGQYHRISWYMQQRTQ